MSRPFSLLFATIWGFRSTTLPPSSLPQLMILFYISHAFPPPPLSSSLSLSLSLSLFPKMRKKITIQRVRGCSACPKYQNKNRAQVDEEGWRRKDRPHSRTDWLDTFSTSTQYNPLQYYVGRHSEVIFPWENGKLDRLMCSLI